MGLALAASKESSIREPACALSFAEPGAALLRKSSSIQNAFRGASAAPWSFGKCSTSEDVFIATLSAQIFRHGTIVERPKQPGHTVFAAKERREERRRCGPIEHDRACVTSVSRLVIHAVMREGERVTLWLRKGEGIPPSAALLPPLGHPALLSCSHGRRSPIAQRSTLRALLLVTFSILSHSLRLLAAEALSRHGRRTTLQHFTRFIPRTQSQRGFSPYLAACNGTRQLLWRPPLCS